MKLGLLVVLAVAVLVPSLSEGRIVSRCELKKKLGERLALPERFQKFEDTILKVVICNMKWRTHLRTDKIRVLGHPRKTTTTTKPVTTTPVTTTPVTTTPAPIRPVTTTTVPTRPVTTTTVPTRPVTTTTVPTRPVTTTTVPTRPVTTTTVPTRPVTTKPTTTESMATNPVTTTPTTTESATAEPTTTESVATNPAATGSTSAGATRAGSNQTTAGPGSNRRKREANATSDESDSQNTDGSLEDMLNEEQVKFDEEQLWQDENRMDDEDNENDEAVSTEDGGNREKRSFRRGKGRGRKVKSWSLGYYGIFGLTDSHFCNSGYRWSRNACKTSCSAFTDEDISDDCDCAVKTHYWLPLFWSAPRWCRRVSVQRFFRGCD